MSTPTILPLYPGLHIERISAEDDGIVLLMSTTAPFACCPLCGKATQRVHSCYRRTLTDLPWNHVRVRIHLLVRKWFCDNLDCERTIFAESVPALAARYARKTRRFQEVLYLLGYALGGEAGAWVAFRLGLIVSPDTLLRRLRQAGRGVSNRPSEPVRVLGVDDWAYRKGQRYGTILVDLERHCPLDLLPDRSAETLAEWLKAHPGVEVVSRDRASAYAEGIRQGATAAQQVADRFHLTKSLLEALQNLLTRHHRHLHDAARRVYLQRHPVEDNTGDALTLTISQTRLQRESAQKRERRVARYEQVRAYHRQGANIRQIAGLLHMHRRTVRQFIRAPAFPERAPPSRHPTQQDAFVDYLKQRWNEGCHNAAQLWRELKERGYAGQPGALRRYLSGWRPRSPEEIRRTRGKKGVSKCSFASPSARTTAWLLLLGSQEKDEAKRQWAEEYVACLVTACSDIRQAQKLGRSFMQMVRERQSEQLDGWMQEVAGSALSEFTSLAKGLQADRDAVVMALTTQVSNGQVEGQVNRLKLVKRSMYGRAKLDLLRARVLPMATAA